jgi:mannose-6-phosphate isomerase-like protein (cupin superfamily)
MPDVTVKRIDEFETEFGGLMKRARSGLGVTAFGMQVLDLPAYLATYPEHNHLHDGQEEVYTVLKGRALLHAAGATHELEPGVFVRVGPGEQRRLATKEERATVLCLGGMPGDRYTAPPWSEEGSAPPPYPPEIFEGAAPAPRAGAAVSG